MIRKYLILILLCVTATLAWSLNQRGTSGAGPERSASSDNDSAIEPLPPRLSDSGSLQLILPPQVGRTVTVTPEVVDWGVDWKEPRKQAPTSRQAAIAQGVIVGERDAPRAASGKNAAAESYEGAPASDDARVIFSGLGDDQSNPVGEGNNRASNGISGYRVASDSVAGSDATATPQPTATPVDSNLLPWARGQARGYAMLYAMHLKARPLVEQQVTALIDARIREPYIGVLVDGTFGQDFEFIKNIVGRLAIGGRQLTLALYFTNGATMRKWDTTPIHVLFNQIDPTIFRELIENDQEIRNQYVGVVNKAKGLFAANTAANPLSKNVAIVMLEDNLDSRSYGAMRSLASEQLGADVVYIRNPCVGCYADGGSDGDTRGDGREEHRTEDFRILGKGDGYTLDGVGFEYPEELGSRSESSGAISSDGVMQMMNEAYTREFRYVGLWRHGWQGVRDGVANKHPDQRTYKLSTDAEVQFEISALRHGLEVENP